MALETLDNCAVHLADAAFGQVERGADFFHRHLLVVVEDHDEALVAIEATSDELHQVAVLKPARRVFRLLVLENVDLADVLVAIGLVPLLVQADERDGRRFAQVFLKLVESDVQPKGEFNNN